MEDFKYETYENYLSMIENNIWSFGKNTFINKEDIIQDVFLGIVDLEHRIDKMGVENIKYLKSYLYFIIKRLVRKTLMKNFNHINTYHLDVDELSDYIPDRYNYENNIMNKMLFDEICKICYLTDRDRNMLLGSIKNEKNKVSNLKRRIRGILKRRGYID